MPKRGWTTWIVLAVFLALLAYVLLVEVKRDPPPEPGVTPSPTAVPVLDVETSQIQGLTIDDGTQRLRLEVQEDVWQVVEPEAGPADTDTVFFQVDSLAHLQAQQVVVEVVDDPAGFGLTSPALTVTLELAGGQREQIVVGREAPGGAGYYVQRAGEARLYLVSPYTLAPFFEWPSTPPYALPESG